MKNKISYNTLVTGNLRHRKKQYLLLIIGIIISMIFSSFAMFMCVSSFNSMASAQETLYGQQDFIISNLQAVPNGMENFEKWYPQGGYIHFIGYGTRSGAEPDADGNAPDGVAIGWLDKKGSEIYSLEALEGRFPEKSGEIAIEKRSLFQMDIDAQIGDKITLTVEVADGENFLPETVEKEYTLVGIVFDRHRSIETAMGMVERKHFEKSGIPTAYVAEGTKVEVGGKESIAGLAFTGEMNTDPNFADTGYYFLEDCYGGEVTASDYARCLGINSYTIWQTYNNYMTPNSPMMLCALLSLCMMLIADLGVVNAFGTNLRERKKQIGLLRSVGATKRQIRRIYLREAGIISLICAPVSLAVAAVLVKIIIKLLNEAYIFTPVWWVFPVGAVVSIIFVTVAAYIPLISASRISPMQAIRKIDNIRKLKKRKIKTQTKFEVPKLLAKRGLRLNRGVSVVAGIILGVSIVASFYLFSYLDTELENIKNEEAEYDYYINQQSIWFSGIVNYPNAMSVFTENERRDILLNPYIEAVDGYMGSTVAINRDSLDDYNRLANYYGSIYRGMNYTDLGNTEKITKENYRELLEYYDEETQIPLRDLNIENEVVSAEVVGLPEDAFELLKKEANCNVSNKKFDSGEEVIFVAPQKLALVMEHDYSIDEYGNRYNYSYVSCWNADKQYAFLQEDQPDFLEGHEITYKAGDELSLTWITSNYNEFYATRLDDYNGTVEYDKEKMHYETLTSNVKIAAVANSTPSFGEGIAFADMGHGLKIYTTIEGYKKLTKDENYRTLLANANTEITDEIDKDIETSFQQLKNYPESYYKSVYSFAKDNEQGIYDLYILLLAVTMLLYSMCGSLVNNFLTARIRAGKKEIGTLRAVGASIREISSSYIRQLAVILGGGTLAGVIGAGVFYLLIYLIIRSYNQEIDLTTFSVWETLTATALLFITCTVNIFSKIKKEMKNSIVENIREL